MSKKHEDNSEDFEDFEDAKASNEKENPNDDKKGSQSIMDTLREQKWIFIVVVIVIIVAVIIGVSVKNSKSSSPNTVDDVTSTTQSIEEQITKESSLLSPENESYVNNMENKPQTDTQKAALNVAIEYYKYSGFSHNSIVNQLISDGYSKEDANYAADNCGADWNEVAKKSAVKYVSYEPSSRLALVEKLIADGFTKEQAELAADNSGIDYVEQAKNSALVYLKVENYDKAKLMELLVNNDGYTEKEASDGIDLALEK